MIYGYDIKDIVIWTVIIFVVWQVLGWLWEFIPSLFHRREHYHHRRKNNKIIMSIIIILLFVGIYAVATGEIGGGTIDKIKDKINEIGKGATKIGLSGSCEKKAIEMTPKYWVASRYSTKKENKWSDGTEIYIKEYDSEECFRKGSNEGENINYYYYACDPPTYSKTIISSKGEVLGTTTFTINPIFKTEENINWSNNAEIIKFTDSTKIIKFTDSTKAITPEENVYIFSWTGFSDKVKEIFGIDEFNIKVSIEKECYANPSSNKKIVLCDETFTEEEGIFKCDLSKIKEEEENWCKIKMRLEIPDIFDKTIYEVIEYNVENCNWVEEK